MQRFARFFGITCLCLLGGISSTMAAEMTASQIRARVEELDADIARDEKAVKAQAAVLTEAAIAKRKALIEEMRRERETLLAKLQASAAGQGGPLLKREDLGFSITAPSPEWAWQTKQTAPGRWSFKATHAPTRSQAVLSVYPLETPLDRAFADHILSRMVESITAQWTGLQETQHSVLPSAEPAPGSFRAETTLMQEAEGIEIHGWGYVFARNRLFSLFVLSASPSGEAALESLVDSLAFEPSAAEAASPAEKKLAYVLGRAYALALNFHVLHQEDASAKALEQARSAATALGLAEPSLAASRSDDTDRVLTMSGELAASCGPQASAHFLSGLRLIDAWFGVKIGADAAALIAECQRHLAASGIPRSVWGARMATIQERPESGELEELDQAISAHLGL